MERARERRCLRGTAFFAAAGATVLMVAACGSSGGGSGGTTSSGTTPPPAAAATTAPPASGSGTTVGLRSTSAGQVLVDSRGHTLYLFEKDTGTTSTCSGACATAWPPLTTTGAPVAGTGVNASLLSTTKRADGSTEVTYSGHPLYSFEADTAAGDIKGQGVDAFGGEWYVLSAAGSKVEGHESGSDNPSSGSTGSGGAQTSRPGY